jgi:putative PEP-CTERM system TPR-repeat lipoprotein
VGRARAILELGDYEALVKHIKTDESFASSVNADLLALRAAASAGLEDYSRAAAILAEAAALDSFAFQVYMTRVQLRLDDDDLEAAKAIIGEGLKEFPEDPELLLLQAKIDLAEGSVTQGKQTLQRVIDNDPEGFISIYNVNSRLNLVEQLILEDNLDDAERYMSPLYGRTRNAPYTNYLGGLLAFEQGDYDLAEQRLLKVLKAAPDHAPSRLLFATVNFAQQDYEQAAYFLSKYLATNPDHVAARKLLGRSYMQLDQPGEAQRALQPALGDGTDDAELLILVGLSALRSGDAAAGIEGLERALVLDSKKVSLRKELASIYMTTGETSIAVQELQALIDRGGDEQSALSIIGSLHSGEFERAINASLDLLSSNPGDPVVISLTGNVFAASGDYLEARRYLERALSLQPDFYPASIALARLEELEGNTDRAVTLYRGLVELDVDSVVPVLALARLEGQQGNTQRVADLLQSASEDFPEESRPQLLLAEHYLREKRYEKAALLLDEAQQDDPDQPVVLYMQARLLIASERYKQAIIKLEELLEVDPGSIIARVLLAEAHLYTGSLELAKDSLKVVLRNDPNDLAALALMTKLENVSGNLDTAMRYSQRIQEIHPELYLGYMLQGDVFVKKHDDIAAGRQFELAWNRMRRSELAIRRAEVASRLGQHESAVQLLLAWLADHPGDARVRRFLGATYLAGGQPDKAVEEYLKVLAANASDVTALNNLAWLYFNSDDSRARNMAERAYNIAPGNSAVLDTYGWILLQQGETEKGRQLLSQASLQLPDEAEVSYHYAVALHRSGDREGARQILEALLGEGQVFEGSEQARQLLEEITG